jgi:hypothetical protein
MTGERLTQPVEPDGTFRIPCWSGPLTFQPAEADLPILFDPPRTERASGHELCLPQCTQIRRIGNRDVCFDEAMGGDDVAINLYGAADCSIALARGRIRSLLSWIDADGQSSREQRPASEMIPTSAKPNDRKTIGAVL